MAEDLSAVLARSEALREGLWEILAKNADTYALGDTSLPVEAAQSLYESICFTVSLALAAGHDPAAGAWALYRAGGAIIAERLADGRALYRRALATMLPAKNIAYRDTVAGLAAFFAHYRFDLLAQEIPCSIDYPLFRPVAEREKGVLYINEYLRRLTIENVFCARFPLPLAQKLWRAYCPDPVEQIVNLFQPLADNALGLSLLKKDVLSLDMTAADKARVQTLLCGADKEALQAFFAEAAERLCANLDIHDLPTREYLREAADELAARYHALAPLGGIDGIFLTFCDNV